MKPEPYDIYMDEKAVEVVQASLRGVWREDVNGCPHLHGQRDSVSCCDAFKMAPCVYETGDGPCELFQEILEEWKTEMAPKTHVFTPGGQNVLTERN